MRNLTKEAIEFIRNWFNKNGGQNAVLGISGGKDSTIAAALCKEALGADHVYGVLMPNGFQIDIDDSKRIADFLGIKQLEVNINEAFISIISQVIRCLEIEEESSQTRYNLPPRLRMSVLYAVAQSIPGGRVINTSNNCEAFVGWGTLFGDTVGDVAPLAKLTCSQIREIGHDLGLPADLVDKTPSDGLTGKSDEENLGLSYNEIEAFIEGRFNEISKESLYKVIDKHRASEFKRKALNIPAFIPTSKI